MNKKRRYKSQNQEKPFVKKWEIIYSGFVLILLSFFILLTSFSSVDKAKILSFAKSFTNAISILPGGAGFESGEEVLPESPDIVSKESEMAKLFTDLQKFMIKLGLGKDVELSFSDEGLVMNLADNVLFELGEADVMFEASSLLQKVSSIISKTSYNVRIEGHTDNIPIKTEIFPSNWELSTARAVNVLRYFMKNGKIAADRLSAAGFAEFQPLYDNDSPENRKRNRRVEIVFLFNENDMIDNETKT